MAIKKITDAVFIHVPKTGGLSIEEIFKLDRYRYPSRVKNFNQSGLVTFGHLDYRKLLRNGSVTKEFDNRAFKFAFVRNPYDRAVSHFFYVKKKHPDILPLYMTFKEFTSELGNYSKHFVPQHKYLDNIDIDYLGRFEYYNYCISTLARLFKMDVQIVKKNSTVHGDYHSYYDEESAKNIFNYYKQDFLNFDYEQDSYRLHRQ